MLVVAGCFAADESGNPSGRRYLYTTSASLETAPFGRDPRTVGKLTPHLPAHCMHGPCQSGMLCLLTFVFRLCLSAASSIAGTCIESVEPMYVLCSSIQPKTAACCRRRYHLCRAHSHSAQNRHLRHFRDTCATANVVRAFCEAR